MRRLLFISFVMCLLVLPTASFAQDGGVMPDSIFYGFDVALDQLRLVFTFNHAHRARLALNIAAERLGELEAMSQKANTVAMGVAGDEYNRMIGTATDALDLYEESNATKEAESTIDIEKILLERDVDVERVAGESEFRFTVREKLPEDKLESVRLLLNKIRNKTNEMEAKFETKREKIRERVKEQANLTDEEASEVVNKIESNAGVQELRRKRAQERIDQAKIEYDNLKETIKTAQATEAALILYNQSATHIESADEAFWSEKYGEAYGQATSALNLARNSLRLLQREGEYKIAAVSEGDITRVRVMVGNSVMKFDLNTTDENETLNEIARRTGLEASKVSEAATFKEKKLVGRIEEVFEEEGKVKIQVRMEEQIEARGAKKPTGRGTVS